MSTSPRRRYHHSVRMLVPFLGGLLGVHASLYQTCTLMMQDVHSPLRALNTHHIPPESTFILVLNHYDRPGMGTWWGASAIIATLAKFRADPREFHGVMAREWWYPNGWERKIKQPLTRWAFAQIARAYDMVTLPPVIDEYKGEGGIAVRRTLALTRGEEPELVALAPEGKTGANLALCNPPSGAGLFMHLLSHNKIPFLPAANFEDDDQVLTVNFGTPFMLNVPRTLERAQRDYEASRQVMVEIGKLLPERMWGVYREDIRGALALNKS
jgi:hypothetical protein